MNDRDRKQSGFVSIIVAALIMIILSLITIGFTRIMQREQRQALDRQLSRQALYAAESGVNEVIDILASNPGLPSQKTDCDPNLLPIANLGVIDSSNDVAYTCILYDKAPSALEAIIKTDESKIFPLNTESGNNFTNITIEWGNEFSVENNISSLPACAAAGTFTASRANTAPILRVDLTNTSSLERDTLINGTDYLYLSPCQGAAATHLFGDGKNGKVVAAGCVVAVTNFPCKVTINGLNSAKYAARIRAVYDSANVQITGNEGAGSVKFNQAQTSIDVTARASDVVRRLRVTKPLNEVKSPPEAVIQVFDGICKKIGVNDFGGSLEAQDTCVYP